LYRNTINPTLRKNINFSNREKTMDRDEIISRFFDRLDSHYLRGGEIAQDGYKRLFFQLFKDAYRLDPKLTPDILVNELSENPRGDDAVTLQAKITWAHDHVFRRWIEWQYAWDNYKQ